MFRVNLHRDKRLVAELLCWCLGSSKSLSSGTLGEWRVPALGPKTKFTDVPPAEIFYPHVDILLGVKSKFSSFLELLF